MLQAQYLYPHYNRFLGTEKGDKKIILFTFFQETCFCLAATKGAAQGHYVFGFVFMESLKVFMSVWWLTPINDYCGDVVVASGGVCLFYQGGAGSSAIGVLL